MSKAAHWPPSRQPSRGNAALQQQLGTMHNAMCSLEEVLSFRPLSWDALASHGNSFAMQRQLHGYNSSWTESAVVTVHIKGSFSSLSATTGQLWLSLTHLAPKPFYKPLSKGIPPATAVEDVGVTATTGKQEQLQSDLRWNAWATASPPNRTAKTECPKGGSGCLTVTWEGLGSAQVVCSTPWREGEPGITHREVPNQLRRDTHRLDFVFLFQIFFLKEIAGPQNQWMIFWNPMQKIILKTN